MTVIQSVAGNSLHSFRLAVAEIWGEHVVSTGLARLDPDVRLQVEQAGALLWVPMEVLRLAVDAWATAAGVTGDELTERGVRISTRIAFNTVLRAFLRFTSDEAIISRTPLLYARVRNVGKLVVQQHEGKTARLVLSEWRNGTDRQLLSLAASFETVLELTGRPHARCRFRRTTDGGVFDLTWGNPSAPPARR